MQLAQPLCLLARQEVFLREMFLSTALFMYIPGAAS